MSKLVSISIYFAMMVLIGACDGIKHNSVGSAKQFIQSVVKVNVQYIIEDKTTLSTAHREFVATGFSILADSKANESYILTNKHVCDMKDKAKYELLLSSGKVINATYRAADTFADICLLKANEAISPIQLEKDNAPQGERVMSIGSPNGVFPMIVDGFVSGYYDIHMKSEPTDDADFEVNFRAQVMSTPVSHGASGSPVINGDGKVVGIVFAVKDGSEHISFIVPISEVYRFLDKSEYVHIN